MIIENSPPFAFKWESIPKERIEGESGYSTIQTQLVGVIKIRQVEYSQNYLADHWCEKGHVIFVISGNLYIEHKDNTNILLEPGTTYVVGDNSMPHRASSKLGAKVYIVD